VRDKDSGTRELIENGKLKMENRIQGLGISRFRKI
jgi:hypothetical protein